MAKAKPPARRARVRRDTRETQLTCTLALAGGGASKVDTGLPFLDHMLEQTARYAGFVLRLEGRGDVEIDEHHLTEDAGIVVGQALAAALGGREGIVRFGSAYAPLDEALSRVVIDLSRRPHCYFEDGGRLRGRAGTYATENLVEFFNALAIHAGATIHVDSIRGRDRHHVAESMFKALGLALREAVAMGGGRGVPSSKGVL
ncbi:MAG: imidazoleglycerol-phosphate dehydratase [Chloroflexota bacterium]|jgi:imidazoleglycerol-phosphate dehydratase|nr:imidazoleglycerol-phosphate dehydratase [Chloroflexota bacterium]